MSFCSAPRKLSLCFTISLGLVITASAQQSSTRQWVVAFNQQNSLPANADKIVAAAGGTINIRLALIGGVGVLSSNPNFAADIAKDASVKSADIATATQLIDPIPEPGVTSSTDNGGTYSPTGSDTQAMPDSLGYEQWDKKKLNATLTGSYAIQQGRKDVRVFVIVRTG